MRKKEEKENEIKQDKAIVGGKKNGWKKSIRGNHKKWKRWGRKRRRRRWETDTEGRDEGGR